MDEADQAQRAEAAFLEAALAKAGRPGVSELANADGLCPECPDCIDCGEPISAARRQAVPGCRRCRDCQDWQERQDLYESERP